MTPRPRRTRTGTTAGVVAVLLLLAVAALPAPASATRAQTTTTPTTSAPAGAASGDPAAALTLVEQTPTVAPDGDFTLRLAVDAPAGATLELAVHDRPVGRDQFRDDLVDGPAGAVLGRGCATLVDGGFQVLDPCEVAIERLDRDADGAVTLGVGVRSTPDGAPDRLLIDEDADGAYPVSVRVVDDEGVELERLVTHLLRQPASDDDSPPLDVSIVVPLRGPLALRPDGTRALDPEARAALAGTIDALAGQPDVPVVLVPEPETLDALAVDADGQGQLARLAGALDGRQVIARPYVDVDPGSWWAADLDRDLEDLVTVGSATVREHLGIDPDATTLIVEPTTDGPTLTRLHEEGVDRLVVPQALLAPLDESRFGRDLDRPFAATTPAGPVLPAVMDDAALDAHLGETGDPVLDAHHLLADLTVLYSQYPGVARGVALSLPSPADPGTPATDGTSEDRATFLATLLDGIAASTTLRGATVPDLLDRATTAREGGSDDQDGPTLTRFLLTGTPADLGGYPDARRATEAELAPYRAIAGDADVPMVDELLRVSGARSLSADEQQAYLDGAVAQIDDVASGVVLPPASRVTLTAREGLIPVELRNDLDRPVDVLVRLSSDKLEFPDGDERVVTLPPGPTRLEWLVRTRATGAFPVEVTVLSPDGTVELDTTRFTMRSTAVPGVGIALSAVAAVFLAIWWARHWHTARRARRLV